MLKLNVSQRAYKAHDKIKTMPKRKAIKVSRRNVLLTSIALLIVIFAVYLFFRSPGTKSGTIPSTNPTSENSASLKNQASKAPPQSSSAPDTTQGSDKTQSNTASPAINSSLISPYGNFVSNHHPGGNNPTSEASVCNTTVGATCYIKFIKNDVVKKLTEQNTDSNGATYWYWDIETAGLSKGSWIVEAIASLNGQTKTSTDSLKLEVQ